MIQHPYAIYHIASYVILLSFPYLLVSIHFLFYSTCLYRYNIHFHLNSSWIIYYFQKAIIGRIRVSLKIQPVLFRLEISILKGCIAFLEYKIQYFVSLQQHKGYWKHQGFSTTYTISYSLTTNKLFFSFDAFLTS